MTDKQLPRLEESETVIPDDVLVQCPLVTFEHRHASACASCEHLTGVTRIAEDDPEQNQRRWSDKFRILCGYPINRRTFTVYK